MVYKHFRTLCLVRIALLCATIYLFFFLLLQTTYYATVVIVGGITLFQIFALIHYVERTNRDLTRFLQAIRYEDFSQSFSLCRMCSLGPMIAMASASSNGTASMASC